MFEKLHKAQAELAEAKERVEKARQQMKKVQERCDLAERDVMRSILRKSGFTLEEIAERVLGPGFDTHDVPAPTQGQEGIAPAQEESQENQESLNLGQGTDQDPAPDHEEREETRWDADSALPETILEEFPQGGEMEDRYCG